MNLNNHIPLYSNTSPDWHTEGQKQPYAVDLNVGVNEYIFGRTTPNNKFVVSTGLVNKPFGIEMTGAGKVKTKLEKNKKEKIENCMKNIDKKIKKAISTGELFLKKIAEYSNKSNPNLSNAIKVLKSQKSKDKIKKELIKKCKEIK
jgi:hypothetical protein